MSESFADLIHVFLSILSSNASELYFDALLYKWGPQFLGPYVASESEVQ